MLASTAMRPILHMTTYTRWPPSRFRSMEMANNDFEFKYKLERYMCRTEKTYCDSGGTDGTHR